MFFSLHIVMSWISYQFHTDSQHNIVPIPHHPSSNPPIPISPRLQLFHRHGPLLPLRHRHRQALPRRAAGPKAPGRGAVSVPGENWGSWGFLVGKWGEKRTINSWWHMFFEKKMGKIIEMKQMRDAFTKKWTVAKFFLQSAFGVWGFPEKHIISLVIKLAAKN